MQITFKPIGIVHSPFKSKNDISREKCLQENGFSTTEGELEIFPEFAAGLQDIDGFSHLIVIFAFHQAATGKLTAFPPFDDQERGVFATRSPHRPNAVGMTIVRQISRQDNRLRITGLDMIENTPILDIKPYPRRDLKPEASFGWLTAYHK